MKCSKFFFICQIILTIHCVLFAIQSTAQAPQSFNYQAVVRDSTGALVANQPIGIRASIVADSANGTVVYQETHSINSNDFGLIHLQIGTGSAVSGTFDAIDWSTGTFFTKIEMDETGGTNYQPLSIAPLSSVPYALYAQNVANKDDADADPANELQTISKSGSTVTLSNGGGSFTDAVDDADADPANEIQDITLSGTELTISNGSTIDLSIIQGSSGTDGDWSFNGANLYAAVGGNVGIGAVSPFHKLQVRNTVTDDVLRLQGPDGSYEHGARLNFGDADYVYLDEDEDDKLTIQASGRIALTTGGPIRFDVAGTERWEMIGTRLQPQNTGGSLFIGENAGASDDLSDNYNIFIGDSAGYTNTVGRENTANGNQSLVLNTTGNWNTASGYRSLHDNTTGSSNVANGWRSLYSNTTGNGNTASGVQTSFYNTTGSFNTSHGYNSFFANTSGSYNTVIGAFADVGTGNLTNATAIGSYAMVNTSNSLVLGSVAGVNGASQSVNVGVGTVSPAARLHVVGSPTMGELLIAPNEPFAGDSSMLLFAEDQDGTFGMFWLYDGVSDQLKLFGKVYNASYGPHIAVNRTSGNVGIGTDAPQSKLAVNGAITCKEVEVTLSGFPDYVFHDDYDLMPLNEVAAFIDTHGHLPNIPSEKEVLRDGIGLAQLNVMLVEKVEELTLHTIEQQRLIDKQSAMLREIKQQLDGLETSPN